MNLKAFKTKYCLESFDHSGGRTLWDHLEGVYRILKGWDENEAVCLGGLLHSVYGTEVYRNTAVPFTEREQLQHLAGKRAEKLAYLFSCIERRSIWKNMAATSFTAINRFDKSEVGLTYEDLQDYISIFTANLIEQTPFTKQYYCVSELLGMQRFMRPAVKAEFLKFYELG